MGWAPRGVQARPSHRQENGCGRKAHRRAQQEAGLWADKKAQEKIEAELRNPKPKTEEEELPDVDLDGEDAKAT
eukprot:9330647-Heterocapsa_arctica.AAC.1